MIDKLIDRNIIFINKYTPIDLDDIPVYKYSLQILYSYLINLVIIFTISSVMGRLYESIIMTFVFAIFQVFGGGYHADTKQRCFITMIIGCVIGHILIKVIPWNNIVMIISIAVMGCILFALMPITNKRHPVSKKVFKRSKILSRSILIVVVILVIAFILTNSQIEAATITVTLFLSTVSIVSAYLLSKK